MQDREIVAAIVAGEPDGLAAAYDRYAQSLHTFCRSLLAEQADAADAVQDTFIIAASKAGALRDPDRFRPWLYAVARNECRRRLRARARSAPLEEAGDMTGASTGPSENAERADLRQLVETALGGLNPSDREILELNLRHDFDGADLADALCVPRNQAHALASRARTQFETALGALLVARSGRKTCHDLATILSGWDGQLTVLLRKRVNRHIERCEVCGERKRREMRPAMLLSMLPVAVLPAGLRARVLRLVADVTPEAAAHRAHVIQRAGPFSRSGFPRPVDPPRLEHGPGHYALAAGAAATALAVFSGGVVLATTVDHQRPATPVAGLPAATASPASSSPPVPAATAQTPLSPSPAATTPPPPATTPPPPATTPAEGTLRLSPSAVVNLAQHGDVSPYTGTFVLTAEHGPVQAFAITIPATSAKYLEVKPVTGSLASGQSVTVTVTALPGAKGLPYETDLVADPGGLTIVVHYPPAG